MLTKVVKAKTDWVCYFCGRTIKKGEKYVKVLSPFERSIGMEAICLDCAISEGWIRKERAKPSLNGGKRC